MNLVDSSAWLEYLADGPGADAFEAAINNTRELLVPAICLYEVFKRVLQQRGEADALRAAALMQQGEVLPIDGDLALKAATLGAAHRLPLADAMILAAAQEHDAVLWTMDADFEGLPNVQYFPKTRGVQER